MNNEVTYHTLTTCKCKLFGAVLIQESTDGKSFRVIVRDWRKLGMSSQQHRRAPKDPPPQKDR